MVKFHSEFRDWLHKDPKRTKQFIEATREVHRQKVLESFFDRPFDTLRPAEIKAAEDTLFYSSAMLRFEWNQFTTELKYMVGDLWRTRHFVLKVFFVLIFAWLIFTGGRYYQDIFIRERYTLKEKPVACAKWDGVCYGK